MKDMTAEEVVYFLQELGDRTDKYQWARAADMAQRKIQIAKTERDKEFWTHVKEHCDSIVEFLEEYGP